MSSFPPFGRWGLDLELRPHSEFTRKQNKIKKWSKETLSQYYNCSLKNVIEKLERISSLNCRIAISSPTKSVQSLYLNNSIPYLTVQGCSAQCQSPPPNWLSDSFLRPLKMIMEFILKRSLFKKQNKIHEGRFL